MKGTAWEKACLPSHLRLEHADSETGGLACCSRWQRAGEGSDVPPEWGVYTNLEPEAPPSPGYDQEGGWRELPTMASCGTEDAEFFSQVDPAVLKAPMC